MPDQPRTVNDEAEQGGGALAHLPVAEDTVKMQRRTELMEHWSLYLEYLNTVMRELNSDNFNVSPEEKVARTGFADELKLLNLGRDFYVVDQSNIEKVGDEHVRFSRSDVRSSVVYRCRFEHDDVRRLDPFQLGDRFDNEHYPFQFDFDVTEDWKLTWTRAVENLYVIRDSILRDFKAFKSGEMRIDSRKAESYLALHAQVSHAILHLERGVRPSSMGMRNFVMLERAELIPSVACTFSVKGIPVTFSTRGVEDDMMHAKVGDSHFNIPMDPRLIGSFLRDTGNQLMAYGPKLMTPARFHSLALQTSGEVLPTSEERAHPSFVQLRQAKPQNQ